MVRRSRTRRLEPGEVDDLVRLYERGATVSELADRYSIHRHTVTAHLERSGVSRRGGAPSFDEADLPSLAEQYLEGDSCATIAVRHKVDPATVLRWLRRAGVQMRPRRGGPKAGRGTQIDPSDRGPTAHGLSNPG